MLKVKVKKVPAKGDVCRAVNILPGCLFVDGGGDVYMRCYDGCVMFETNQLTPYSNKEMMDLEEFPWFEFASEVKGDVKVEVMT